MMNELLDQDTSSMTDAELEGHIKKTLMTAHEVIMKSRPNFMTLCKEQGWNSDNQSKHIRALVMTLYREYISPDSNIPVKVQSPEKSGKMFSLNPRRENTVTMHHAGSTHYSFGSNMLALWSNAQFQPQELKYLYKTSVNGEDIEAPPEIAIGAQKLLDSYVLCMASFSDGQYGDINTVRSIFDDCIMNVATSNVMSSETYYYGQNEYLPRGLDKYLAHTIAYTEKFPNKNITRISEYVALDLLPDVLFISRIYENSYNGDSLLAMYLSGNKTLMRPYWAKFLAKNKERLRDEFIDKTYTIAYKAMRDIAGSEELGKVI